MAEIVGSGSVGNDKYWLHTWEGLGNGDTGRPVRVSHMADKTVTVEGTFGASGNCAIEGSMNGTNWYPLTDPQGNALDMAADSTSAITENPRFVRPSVDNGDGTTSLNVRIGASASK